MLAEAYFKIVNHCVKMCAVYIHPLPSSFDTRCQILHRRQMQLKLHSAAAIVIRQVEPWLCRQRLLKGFESKGLWRSADMFCGSLASPDRFCNFYFKYNIMKNNTHIWDVEPLNLWEIHRNSWSSDSDPHVRVESVRHSFPWVNGFFRFL